MNGMKYVGPLILATRDLRALADFCIEAGVMFYYWGTTGAQYVAIRSEQLVGLDQTKLPAVFRDLVWRDSPYETFAREVVEAEVWVEEADSWVDHGEVGTEVVEAEDFVSGVVEDWGSGLETLPIAAEPVVPEPVKVEEPQSEEEQE